MKFDFTDRYRPMLTALKKAGLKVDEVVKQDKKTVITVSLKHTYETSGFSKEKDPGASKIGGEV